MGKVWVLYRGETPIGTGSQKQLAEIAGVSIEHIKKMSTPKYLNSQSESMGMKPNNKFMYVIKVVV